ncbi:MAG: hypothetical protein JSV96_01800 [Candidatus Aminicenantes bacterium]|nr:MAG: hypothetical protein JSV96_01800 [Candidatus Aminicenantes bacterium]
MSDVLRLMIIVLYSWLVLGLIFIGSGILISRIFRRKIEQEEDILKFFWIGWAFVILILQLWHSLFPVNCWIFVFLSITGAVGLLCCWKDLFRLVKRNLLKIGIFLFIVLMIGTWLSNRAVCSDKLYDTGLYHLNSVHWTTTCPIVPGLGNLHGRLAFNNSYFLYAALLEVGPWTLKSQHLSGGLLLLVLFSQILLSVHKIFQGKSGIQTYHVFNIIIFTPILIMGFSDHISSLSPDLPIFVLGIVLSSWLLELIESQKKNSQEKEFAVFSIIIMAVLGITIKISFLAFGLFAALTAAIAGLFDKGKLHHFNRKKMIIWSVICAMMFLVPWVGRGVILSGYMFYPSTIASFPVEWRLPKLAVVEAANWIRGWARKPNVHWKEVLANWDWLKPWANRTLKDYEVVVPMLLLLIGCILLFCSRFHRIKKQKSQRKKWLFLFPALFSLVYWFFTAPALRFAGACFWILGVGVLVFGIKNFKLKKTMTLCFALLILLSWLIQERKHLGKDLMRSKVYPLRYAELKRFKTNSGLIIYVPKKGDQCWNGPLLCTPFPNGALRLRKEGDISKGFVLDLKD